MTCNTPTARELRARGWLPAGAILAVCLLTIVIPIAVSGLNWTPDMPTYLSFAREFQTAFKSGALLPAWTNENFGYGGLGTRFYPPLVPALLGCIEILTGNWAYALWIYFLLWSGVGCSGVYLLVKEFGNRRSAIFAAVCFALAPYHLAQIYQFGLIAEYAATGLIPYVLLFTTRVCRHGRRRDALGLSIVISLFVLTHLPVTIIVALALLPYGAVLVDRRSLMRTVGLFTLAVAISTLATAVYWVPVVSEIQWVAHYGPRYSSGVFDYTRWFFPRIFADSAGAGTGLSAVSNLDRISLTTMAMLSPAVIVLLFKRDTAVAGTRRVMLALTLVSAVAIVMLSVASSPVWGVVTILQKIQFPWRWLCVVSVGAVASMALASYLMYETAGKLRRAVIIAAVGSVSLACAYDIRYSFMHPDTVSLAEFNRAALDPNLPPRLGEPWQPIWAKAPALEINDQVIASGRAVEIDIWNNRERRFRLSDGPATEIRLATFYYPHWRATVNGVSTRTEMDENGALLIPAEDGPADVDVRFEEPALNKSAAAMSAVSWSALAIIGLLAFRRRAFPN